MNNNLKAHFSLFLANFIYGINFTVAKDVMPAYIGPSGFVLIRVIGATALFWLLAKLYPPEKIDRKDYFKLILCSLFGVAINQLLFFEGLNLTTPINASIIMVTTPVLVLVFAAIILRERVTLNKIAGICLGIAGAMALILFNPQISGTFGPGAALGDWFIFINAASYAIYLAMVKPLMYKYKATTIIKWVFLFGLFFVFPVGMNELAAFEWKMIPIEIWVEILFVVICTTFLAYLLNMVALKSVSPSVVSVYIYLQPVLAAAIALSLGKDELNWVKAASAVLIFTGVYLVSKPVKAITA